jgi:hypothetical protein
MLAKLFLITNYLYQYDYYVTVLCENKEKEEIKCNGTCHLAKELKTADPVGSEPELPEQLKLEIALFYQDLEETDLGNLATDNSRVGTYGSLYHSPFLKVTFPPPKV